MSDNNQAVAQPQVEAQEAEAQVVEQPKVNPKEELYSSKFASLTRKEREILQKEREIKAAEAEFNKFKELKGSAKERVNDVLAEMGLTIEDVINAQLGQFEAQEDENTPEAKYKKLEAKLTALEEKELKKQQEMEEEAKKAEQKYIDETISTVKNSINELIQERIGDYELIAAQGAQDTVFDVIEENFYTNGTMLSIEEAANLVEEHLLDEAKAILSRSNKLKNLASPSASQSQGEEEALKKELSQWKKTTEPTLSSSFVASTAEVKAEPTTMSKEESLKRAAAKLKWS